MLGYHLIDQDKLDLLAQLCQEKELDDDRDLRNIIEVNEDFAKYEGIISGNHCLATDEDQHRGYGQGYAR